MINRDNDLYPISYDLSNCDEEPLHLIKSYQLPAILLVTDPEVSIVMAASDNITLLWAGGPRDAIGQSATEVLTEELVNNVRRIINRPDPEEFNPLELTDMHGPGFEHGTNVIIRKTEEFIYLEFEPMQEALSSSVFLAKVDKSLRRVQQIDAEQNLFSTITTEIRQNTGFDRVMLYRFDEKYNGEVVGESVRKDLPAYLNLRYPHTDIPKQSRDFYSVNQVRHITSTREDGAATIHYHPSLTKLDLTPVANRGVSPIHLQYLRNMGVGSTLSIGIFVNKRLWGLIACHHTTPRIIDVRLRSMLRLMVQVVSGHLALWQSSDFRKHVLQTSIIRSRLFERMNEKYDILDGLLQEPADLLQLAGASGAVILLNEEQHHIGNTPKKGEVTVLAEWLNKQPTSSFSSHQFFADYPQSAGFTNPPAGLLSIRLSDSPGEYVMWFRPETVTTINWGGNPNTRKLIKEGRVELHPELSFQKYTEEIKGLAEKWEHYQTDAALTLRSDIKEVILQKYKEIQQLNGQLTSAYEELEGFSYTVSHDLRAPLRNIKGFAEILQEDYFELLDEFGKSALTIIVSSVGRMNEFINNILTFSRLGQSGLIKTEIDLEKLIRDVWKEESMGSDRTAHLTTELQAQTITADHTLLWQVFSNLLSNALKYASKDRDPEVSIRSFVQDDQIVIEVQDNGIGFDMRYAGRIFVVFNRLVAEDAYPGTGIGLSIAKRIVDKHDGKIAVWSAPDEGAKFTLTFPASPSTAAP